MSEQDLTNILDIIIIVIVLTLLLIIYFLPSIIANIRKHSNKLAIFFLNLFTGATGIGWVTSFIWAFIDKSIIQVESKPTVAQELKELSQIKEQGMITQEEFETKKKKLLDS